MVTSLKARAYRHIRSALMEGSLGEGIFLSPAKLAEKIGVSDTPVREAIIQLESEGLIERVPKLGIRARMLNRQELEDMFDLRIVLESGASKLAAKRITPDQLTRLHENCRQHRAALQEVRKMTKLRSEDFLRNQAWQGPLMERLAKLNILFHLSVLSASQSQRLIKTVTDLHILGRVLRSRILLPGQTPLGRLSRDFHFHHRIVRALEKHDHLAVYTWVEKHLTEAKEYHLAAYDWQHQQGPLVSMSSQEWSDDILETINRMEDSLGEEFPPTIR